MLRSVNVYLPTFRDSLSVVPKRRKLSINQLCVKSQKAKTSFAPRRELEVRHLSDFVKCFAAALTKTVKLRNDLPDIATCVANCTYKDGHEQTNILLL